MEDTKLKLKLTDSDLVHDVLIIVYEHELGDKMVEIGRLKFMDDYTTTSELGPKVDTVVKALREAYESYPDAGISIQVVMNYMHVNL